MILWKNLLDCLHIVYELGAAGLILVQIGTERVESIIDVQGDREVKVLLRYG